MTKLIVADMDGTVVDSMAALSMLGTTLMAVAASASIEAARAHYDATVGQPFVDQLSSWAGGSHLCNGSSVKQIAERYNDMHRVIAPYFPLTDFGKGLVEYRHDLHPDVLFALVTSTPKEIAWKMPQIRHIAWSFMGGYEGPGTEKTQQIGRVMKQLHIGPENMVYVGDSPSDEAIAEFYDIPFFLPTATTLTEINAHSKIGV